MQELADSLREVTPEDNSNEFVSREAKILQESAEKWAIHSLRTYKDDLLKKALGISESISGFVSELSDPKEIAHE